MDFALPRGLRDIEPDEEESAEIVRANFLDTCKLFDYRTMEPSSLELLETLEAKSGPAIRDEIYYFKDKSDRDLGLRFDLTVGMTRYVASKRELGPPIRLAAFSSVWRYDEPQYGKYRWFYQWDAELFGPSSSEADSEIIEFTSVLFRKLGTSPTISIGSRRVLETFIRNELKVEAKDKILDFMRAIDKLEKKSFDEIVAEYSHSFDERQFKQLVDFVKLATDTSKVANSLSEIGIDSTALLNITDSLKSRGVKDVELNLSIVRGIDYYTDMVFEAYDKENRRLGALCGGGRYDSLPSIYGRPDLGATGVAGGVERAILAYKFSKKETARVFVAPVGDNPKIVAIASSVAAGLRSEGIPAQSEITGRSLRRILEIQSYLGTRAVVIVGEREIAQKVVKVKWMKTGEENTVALSELKRALS